MSIAQIILATSTDEYNARDRLRDEMNIRSANGFGDTIEYAELADTFEQLQKEIAEREYAIFHGDDYEFEPDYEDIASRRGPKEY